MSDELKKCRYCKKEKEDVIYTEYGYCCNKCHELMWKDDLYGDK